MRQSIVFLMLGLFIAGMILPAQSLAKDFDKSGKAVTCVISAKKISADQFTLWDRILDWLGLNVPFSVQTDPNATPWTDDCEHATQGELMLVQTDPNGDPWGEIDAYPWADDYEHHISR